MPENPAGLMHYARGERLRADTVNALIDAIQRGDFDVRRAPSREWPIPFKNTNVAEMPAFGVAEIKSPLVIADMLGCNVDKVPGSNAELRRRYLVNGPTPARASGTGWGCLLESANWILYETGDGVPDVNSEWGVVPGSWKIGKDRYGFRPRGATQSKYGGVVLADQHELTNVLCKAASVPWEVGSDKTVNVWKKNFSATTSMTVTLARNYTTKISNTNDELVGTWYAGGLVVAKLKC